MNVFFLTHTTGWGGSEIHTLAFARALAARGHRVCIVALGADVFRERAEGIDVQTPPLPRPLERMTLHECAAALRPLQGGAAVMVRSGMEVGSLRLDMAARLHFPRYITIEHSWAELPPKTSRRHFFGLLPGLGLWRHRLRLLWYCRSVLSHRVVCVSQTARGQMMRNFRLSPRKVAAVPNGIDADKYRPDAERRSAVRRAWGVPDDAVVLGAVGRLCHVKGFDVAIDLFGRLAARRPERNLRLVLIGDGEDRESLQKAARASGFGDRILFPGFTNRPWEAYCGLDVFLLPSREEALPLSLLEAMACGCRPVAMGVGGVPEVLDGAGAGWLVPPGDLDGFLAGMDEATALDPEQQRERGQAARARVASHFNAAVQFEALAQIIEHG
jgi:glycosyltransferase involved in cell wall biosynthesis